MPVTICPARPDEEPAHTLLAELDAHQLALPYPEESRHAFSVERLLREQVALFVAFADDVPAACGGVKLFGADYGEVKRMYVRPAFRGQGLGKAILDHLAAYTRAHGVPLLRLETGIYQPEAIGLYERAGFVRRPPFGAYREDPNSVYFERRLA